jgi:hypothetical protein
MPVLVVGVSGDIPYEELRNMAKKILSETFKRIDGVSHGSINMLIVIKNFHVDLDPKKVRRTFI